MENADRKLYATQFHPEVTHTREGRKIISNFVDFSCLNSAWASYAKCISNNDEKETLRGINLDIYEGEKISKDKKSVAFSILFEAPDRTLTTEEVDAEIKKILKNDIKVHANCAFVPTFIGDGAFVNAEFDDEVEVDVEVEIV